MALALISEPPVRGIQEPLLASRPSSSGSEYFVACDRCGQFTDIYRKLRDIELCPDCFEIGLLLSSTPSL